MTRPGIELARVDWVCLSLIQPWPWIIIHLNKRLENRGRNIGNYRGPLLLHASKRMPESDWHSAVEFVHREFGREAADSIPAIGDPALVLGAVVARTGVLGQIIPPPNTQLTLADIEVRTALRVAGYRPDDQVRWYMGAHAYILGDVVKLEPVPVRGQRGFWRPPEGLAAQLRERR